jgi:hypothetical protein
MGVLSASGTANVNRDFKNKSNGKSYKTLIHNFI